MKTKESIISILKELEQDLAILEEQLSKKTNEEINETAKEFSYQINKEKRELETDMARIENRWEAERIKKQAGHPFETLKLIPIS